MIAIKSLMIKQLYLMKTTQQKSNKCGNKNENVSYILLPGEHVEYLKGNTI